jgi:hypothetical protein
MTRSVSIIKVVSHILFYSLVKDLCKLCVESKCVLPSIESLMRRLKDPKAYCIFYMFFYTAAVGEVQWKKCLTKEEGRIGSNTMEAFALLVLVNNYKAWLYEEKKTHLTNLLTEYDSPPSYGKPSIVDKLLDGVQFNLGIVPSSPTVIYNREDRTFKKLVKERNDWLEAFCKTAACMQTKEDVLKKASTDTGDESMHAETTADDDLIILKERAKKKRKLTRELREFTGEASQGERKHKGWSDQGMEAFEKYVEEIKKDVEQDKYVAWENAYREVMKKLGHSRTKESENKVDEPRYKPNHSIVYEGF